MKNMFLERLYLVRPKYYPNAEATARASGADDVLAAAKVCQTLDEALAGCGLVLGMSARLRKLPWPQLDARAGARLAVAESARTEVALVFGNEHSGLTNEELERCNYLVHVPANPAYSSLNLGAAVQVIAYEVMMAEREREEGSPRVSEATEPALANELELFYEHLQRMLIEVGFLDPGNPRHLMRRMRRLFGRARVDKNEMNILRGILSAVDARIRPKH
jgi:TrmH family RNA methyltransferase